jgi:hypothetical protein
MAQLEIIALDEVAPELEAPQAGDTYVAKRDVSIEGDLAVTGTVDGRDVATDGGVLDTALQPGDNVSDLVNDSGFEANVALASQPEAEAGTENTKTMTALRVAQAITALTTAVAASGDSDDLTEGTVQLLLTAAERAKLAFITITQAVDLDALESTLDDLTALTTGITAYAGGGQANATLLSKGYNVIATVATTADSVKLPTAEAGLKVTIANQGANSADVFPNVSDKIGTLAIDTAQALAADATLVLYAIDNVTWVVL